MPGRPLVTFDGTCGFCCLWISYFKALTGDLVDYAASDRAALQSIEFASSSGETFTGARAVFELLRYDRHHRWLAWLYERSPVFAALSEWAYRKVAANRPFINRLTRWFLGKRVRPLSYVRTEWLFVRALAAIYFIAFASFAVQVRGLIGSRGILPLGGYLRALSESFETSRYWLVPSIFWLRHDDAFLSIICVAGAALAIVLLLGFAQRTILGLLFVLYLSLCSAGQDFMSFQWDMLLLEAGFLSIFLGSSTTVVWLMRWLLFRLMFLSGSVKLLSHDQTWRTLDAMRFHYWTQPLPTPIAWYINQLPAGFHRASTAMVFVIELMLPFLIFAPRRPRRFAAFGFIFLQLLILASGNYAFFNILTIALCLFLLDDSRLPGQRLPKRILHTNPRVAFAVLVIVAIISGSQLTGTFFGYTPPLTRGLLRFSAPFGIVNTYGLFAVMTTERPEIIVQGSNDGATWLDYDFRYKPGNLRRSPPWVAPHQPRLDWQMWFAALSNWRSNPWFANFMVRLLEGSPDVLQLLEKNPFGSTPPKYVRALVYNYGFTDFTRRRATGEWWRREPKGLYFPQISLADVR